MLILIPESPKKIPIKIIKYEDLLNYTYVVFTDIIKFIYEITNNKQRLDKEKIKKTLRTTNFDALKKNEISRGFSKQFLIEWIKIKKFLFLISVLKIIGRKF